METRRKNPWVFFFALHKTYTLNGFLISEFIVTSVKWILNGNNSLLILAPRQVFLSSDLCMLNILLGLLWFLSQASEIREV